MRDRRVQTELVASCKDRELPLNLPWKRADFDPGQCMETCFAALPLRRICRHPSSGPSVAAGQFLLVQTCADPSRAADTDTQEIARKRESEWQHLGSAPIRGSAQNFTPTRESVGVQKLTALAKRLLSWVDLLFCTPTNTMWRSPCFVSPDVWRMASFT